MKLTHRRLRVKLLLREGVGRWGVAVGAVHQHYPTGATRDNDQGRANYLLQCQEGDSQTGNKMRCAEMGRVLVIMVTIKSLLWDCLTVKNDKGATRTKDRSGPSVGVGPLGGECNHISLGEAGGLPGEGIGLRDNEQIRDKTRGRIRVKTWGKIWVKVGGVTIVTTGEGVKGGRVQPSM